MVTMEDNGYVSGSQVEKHIESFGIKKPSPRFISLFFTLIEEESIPSVSMWYKPKGDLTIPQIKAIIEKGNLSEKSKETLKAIKAIKDAQKGKLSEDIKAESLEKKEEIWKGVEAFVTNELAFASVAK